MVAPINVMKVFGGEVMEIYVYIYVFIWFITGSVIVDRLTVHDVLAAYIVGSVWPLFIPTRLVCKLVQVTKPNK